MSALQKGVGFPYMLEMLTIAGVPDTSAVVPAVTVNKDGVDGDIAIPPTQVGETHKWYGVFTNAEADAKLVHLTAIRGGDTPCHKSYYPEGDYTPTRAAYLDILNGLVAAIWDTATSGLAAAGSIGKFILDRLNDTVSIKAKTDNLPEAPAAVGSAMTLDSTTHTTIAADTQTGMTAQGYTATRAPYLDDVHSLYSLIDVTLSTRASAQDLSTGIASVIQAIDSLPDTSDELVAIQADLVAIFNTAQGAQTQADAAAQYAALLVAIQERSTPQHIVDAQAAIIDAMPNDVPGDLATLGAVADATQEIIGVVNDIQSSSAFIG